MTPSNPQASSLQQQRENARTGINTTSQANQPTASNSSSTFSSLSHGLAQMTTSASSHTNTQPNLPSIRTTASVSSPSPPQSASTQLSRTVDDIVASVRDSDVALLHGIIGGGVTSLRTPNNVGTRNTARTTSSSSTMLSSSSDARAIPIPHALLMTVPDNTERYSISMPTTTIPNRPDSNPYKQDIPQRGRSATTSTAPQSMIPQTLASSLSVLPVSSGSDLQNLRTSSTSMRVVGESNDNIDTSTHGDPEDMYPHSSGSSPSSQNFGVSSMVSLPISIVHPISVTSTSSLSTSVSHYRPIPTSITSSRATLQRLDAMKSFLGDRYALISASQVTVLANPDGSLSNVSQNQDTIDAEDTNGRQNRKNIGIAAFSASTSPKSPSMGGSFSYRIRRRKSSKQSTSILPSMPISSSTFGHGADIDDDITSRFVSVSTYNPLAVIRWRRSRWKHAVVRDAAAAIRATTISTTIGSSSPNAALLSAATPAVADGSNSSLGVLSGYGSRHQQSSSTPMMSSSSITTATPKGVSATWFVTNEEIREYMQSTMARQLQDAGLLSSDSDVKFGYGLGFDAGLSRQSSLQDVIVDTQGSLVNPVPGSRIDQTLVGPSLNTVTTTGITSTAPTSASSSALRPATMIASSLAKNVSAAAKNSSDNHEAVMAAAIEERRANALLLNFLNGHAATENNEYGENVADGMEESTTTAQNQETVQTPGQNTSFENTQITTPVRPQHLNVSSNMVPTGVDIKVSAPTPDLSDIPMLENQQYEGNSARRRSPSPRRGILAIRGGLESNPNGVVAGQGRRFSLHVDHIRGMNLPAVSGVNDTHADVLMPKSATVYGGRPQTGSGVQRDTFGKESTADTNTRRISGIEYNYSKESENSRTVSTSPPQPTQQVPGNSQNAIFGGLGSGGSDVSSGSLGFASMPVLQMSTLQVAASSSVDSGRVTGKNVSSSGSDYVRPAPMPPSLLSPAAIPVNQEQGNLHPRFQQRLHSQPDALLRRAVVAAAANSSGIDKNELGRLAVGRATMQDMTRTGDAGDLSFSATVSAGSISTEVPARFAIHPVRIDTESSGSPAPSTVSGLIDLRHMHLADGSRESFPPGLTFLQTANGKTYMIPIDVMIPTAGEMELLRRIDAMVAHAVMDERMVDEMSASVSRLRRRLENCEKDVRGDTAAAWMGERVLRPLVERHDAFMSGRLDEAERNRSEQQRTEERMSEAGALIAQTVQRVGQVTAAHSVLLEVAMSGKMSSGDRVVVEGGARTVRMRSESDVREAPESLLALLAYDVLAVALAGAGTAYWLWVRAVRFVRALLCCCCRRRP